MGQKCYQINVEGDASTVTFQGTLDYYGCKNFVVETKEDSPISQTHVSIDCENVESIPKDWIRAIIKLQTYLGSHTRTLKLVNVNQGLIQHLKKEGVENVFKIVKAEQDDGKKSLDAEFINPFLNATLNVLQVQAQVEARADKIYCKKPSENVLGDIAGTIEIKADAFEGSVIISFPEKTFLKVMSNMLGEEFVKIEQDLLSGAGEITNMIFGQAKIVLNQKGYGIKTALPSVATGKKLNFASVSKRPVVVIPFKSSAGDFYVEICLS